MISTEPKTKQNLRQVVSLKEHHIKKKKIRKEKKEKKEECFKHQSNASSSISNFRSYPNSEIFIISYKNWVIKE